MIFGCLGDDPQGVIEAAVEERMQELHDASTHSSVAYFDFLRVEDSLRSELLDNVSKYEEHCTAYRFKHDLRLFDWCFEIVEHLPRILLGKAPLSPALQASYRERFYEQERSARQWDEYPVLKLRSGVVDSLAVPDGYRCARWLARSSRSQKIVDAIAAGEPYSHL